MSARQIIARSITALVLSVSAGAVALPPGAAHAAEQSAPRQSCTKTSSGTCIKGGQFCPKAKYGQSGWDAAGRRWVCKGNHSHPHWMKP